jgi:FKBP-type peptidyl-prolyl cis-trans isomerase
MILRKSGNGTRPLREQTVSIHMSLDLLDGTHCYDSDSLGAIIFTIGKGEVSRGLEEGVQLMEVNDEALFILPAHLGFGLTGDGGKVPPNRALKYRVKLLSVIN